MLASVASAISGVTVATHPPILDRLEIRYQLPQDNRSLFVGRVDILKDLTARLEKGGHQVALTACKGMGGVGKSWIAAHYFHGAGYHHKIWFNAENLESLEGQYVDLGLQLRLFGPEDLKTRSKQALFLEVKTYLESLTDSPLIVYDNAPSYRKLEYFIPRKGKVLITTREVDWPAATRLDVDMMTEEDAAALVVKMIGARSPVEVKSLVDTLGRLPLAMTQACAYIQYAEVSVQEYLSLYESLKQRMLADGKLLPGHTHENVWVTFILSAAKIRELNPASEVLLNYTGFLAPEIPRALLEAAFADPPRFDASLELLHRYSLIQYEHSRQLVLIHRVLQDVVREQATHIAKTDEVTLRKLLEVLPQFIHTGGYRMADIERVVPFIASFEIMLKHFDRAAVGAKVLSDKLLAKEMLLFLNSLVCIYTFFQNPVQKGQILERVKRCENFLYGGQTLDSLQEEAAQYGAQGNLPKAIHLYAKAVKIEREREAYRNLPYSLQSLGLAYGEHGLVEIERDLLKLSLHLLEIHGGAHEGGVIIARMNLTCPYSKLSEFEKQAQWASRAVREFKEHFRDEPNHIFTLIATTILASAEGHLGRPERQVELLEACIKALREQYATNRIFSGIAIIINRLFEAYKAYPPERRQILLDHILLTFENEITPGPKMLYRLGYILWNQRTIEAAKNRIFEVDEHIHHLEELIKILPGFHAPFGILACYKQIKGLFEEARAYFESSLGLSLDTTTLAMYANFLYQQKQYVEAARFAQQALQAFRLEDDLLWFDETKKAVLPEALREWSKQSSELVISPGLMAHYLLIAATFATDPVAAKALLPALQKFVAQEWAIGEQHAWYILAKAASLVDANQLALQAYSCVGVLPEEDILLKMSLELICDADPGFSGMALDTRRLLMRAKMMSQEISPAAAYQVAGVMGGAAAVGDVGHEIVFKR
jgi:tetratricopeptide (TPR) repeat protein